MNKIIIWAFTLLLATFGGCATTNESASYTEANTNDETSVFDLPAVEAGARPEWLCGKSAGFPQAEFITQQGQGESANQAASVAYQNIVELLRPLPEADDISQLKPEIRIVGLWQRGGTFHALAVFPRKTAYEYLKGKLDSLDAATQKNVADIEATDQPLTKIGLLHMAIQRQKLRAAYQHSFKVADIKGRGRESPWNTLKWSKEIEQLMTELSIRPTVDQNAAESAPLLTMLKNGLIKAGIESGKTKSADTIRGMLKISYEDTDDGWVQAYGILDIQLSSGDNLQQFGSKTWKLETTALNADTAKKRILNKSKRILEEGLRDVIIEIAMDSDTNMVQ